VRDGRGKPARQALLRGRGLAANSPARLALRLEGHAPDEVELLNFSCHGKLTESTERDSPLTPFLEEDLQLARGGEAIPTAFTIFAE